MDKFKIIIEYGDAEKGITRRTINYENLTEAIQQFCNAVAILDKSQITLVRVMPLHTNALV